jgi:hypothetical protein
MSYIGQGLPTDTFSGFTTDSFSGDGSATTFTLSKAPFSEDGLIVVINNVIQQPTTNFTVSGTTLTIVGTAVATGNTIYAIHTSGAVPSTLASKVDVNGLSDGVILDADADTTISADTDDQIDFKVGGNDTHVFDANGHVTLKQFLDATTAGGRVTGASNRGSNARVNLYQTAGSSDGGEIRLETANTSNSMTEAVRIHNNQVMSASAGIALGVGTANTSSNVLDDYEEGTWTPVLSADATPTAYGSQVGVYTKVGRKVTVIFTFNISTIGSFAGAAVKVTGFPFAAGDHGTHTFGTLFLDGTASEVQAAGDLGIKLSNNTSQALFQGNSGNVSGDNNINANKIDTGTFIHGTITYFTS